MPVPSCLKLNIQKTKIMASVPITSWQIDGETVETVADFIFGARQSLQMVTAAMKLSDADKSNSNWLKIHLLGVLCWSSG